jgi:holo-ACP synthase/triphosphoribosyl-dephospho-CoA synthase
VLQHALPVLLDLTGRGFSLNDAGVVAFLSLLAHVGDTNFIFRSDLTTLTKVQAQIGQFLQEFPGSIEAIRAFANRLDELFIKDNVSPGGCADLLAIAYMFYFLECQKDRKG